MVERLIRRLARASTRFAEYAAGPMWPDAAIRITDGVSLPKIGQRVLPPYFQGQYSSFHDVPSDGANPYDGDPWIHTAEDAARDIRLRCQASGFAIAPHLLPFVTLIADRAKRNQHVRVLDFGGGVGDNFLQVDAVIDEQLKPRVQYHIVDTPRNRNSAIEQLRSYADRVCFPTPEQALRSDYDILMLCGTLMYVENWQALLGSLAVRTRDVIYIARTPANRHVPTFYVRQLIVPSNGPWAKRFVGATPMAIINPAEIRCTLEAAGFNELYWSPLFSYSPDMSTSRAPHCEIVQATAAYVRV